MKKLLLAVLLSIVCIAAKSQIIDLKSDVSLSTDTVTNAGTTYLGSIEVNGPGTLTVQINATKISGTVAGTISLLGSLDGTNFKALTIAEASTALNTYTATDVASQTFIWRLSSNPCRYYRVSWTGTGTMSASFNARLLKR